MRGIIAAGGCVLLGACSSIIEGRSQDILVNTNSLGAEYGLYRQGIRIATVSTHSEAPTSKSASTTSAWPA